MNQQEPSYSQIAAHYARMRRIAAQATGEPIPERVARLLAPHWLYGYNTGCTDGAAKEIARADTACARRQ